MQALLTGLVAGLALGDPGNAMQLAIRVISTLPSAAAGDPVFSGPRSHRRL